MHTSKKKTAEEFVDATRAEDFLEYSRSILANLQRMAEVHGMLVYAHLLNLASTEAGHLIKASSKAVAEQEVRVADQKF